MRNKDLHFPPNDIQIQNSAFRVRDRKYYRRRYKPKALPWIAVFAIGIALYGLAKFFISIL